MPYKPRVHDYVVWHTTPSPLQGWVYFVDTEYITIEVSVKCKDDENIKHCSLHKKYHCLVLCFPSDWHQLEYIKNRRDE